MSEPGHPYVLATGAGAVRRLRVLHDIYAPVGRRVLLHAGLAPGMRVADFGCGVGAVTRMLAEMVGPGGSVTGIDMSPAQLVEAKAWCDAGGLGNVAFLHADACETALPAASFDLVYCRFLLLHPPDPMRCLHEMRRVLRPDGILVVEDGDLASATSVPAGATDAFADLLCRFGPLRGLDYSIGRTLYHRVIAAGFGDVDVEMHQPALPRGEARQFLKWSVEEAGPMLIDAGIVGRAQLARTLALMQEEIDDPEVLILAPLMTLVWARKAAAGAAAA